MSYWETSCMCVICCKEFRKFFIFLYHELKLTKVYTVEYADNHQTVIEMLQSQFCVVHVKFNNLTTFTPMLDIELDIRAVLCIHPFSVNHHSILIRVVGFLLAFPAVIG